MTTIERRRVFAIGAGVGVAAGCVMTMLVINKDPEATADRESRDLPRVPAIAKTLPDPTPKPRDVIPDVDRKTAPTAAKAEADQAKAVAAQQAREEAISNARRSRMLGQTAGLTSLTATADFISGTSDNVIYPGMFKPPPTVSLGLPKITAADASASDPGWLDKAIVRRYIKRNLQKIEYCYHKELLGKPTLEGVVSASFVIQDNGTVVSATASGVDGEVASCIGNVIGGIAFPRPKGTGGVAVAYPLTLKRPS